tara:strand:+ start:81 stop:1064 length:984 start_codon:yes stop_codon:yes gene_type:complete
MKILLTGATGFLGFRTLEYLVGFNYVKSIIATGRKLDEKRKIVNSKVKYILGDLTNEIFVNELTYNVDVIINTAALSSPWGIKKEFEIANVLTQKYLIQSASRNKISRFIYISSPSVYYNGKDRFNVKESDSLPKNFVNHYSKTKREAEILLEDSALDYIILRPRAIIGRGDTVIMPRLINAYNLGRLKIIGNGKNLVDLTSVLNVAHAIERSIVANERAINNIYNITDAEPVLLWKNINTVIEGIGMKRIKNKINFGVANSAAFFLELISKYITKKEPSLTRYSVGVLSKNFTLDISKAKKILAYSPIIKTDESINEFIKWFKSNE